MTHNKEQLVVRCPKKLKEDILNLTKLPRRSVSDYVRLVLEDAIKNKTKV